MLLHDVKSTRLLEKKLVSTGHTEISLMMKAGNSIFSSFKDIKNTDIVIIAGPGNNGGDAFACAIQAHLNNFNIQCISLGINKGHAKKVKDLAGLLNIKITNQLPKKSNIKNNTIIIDGILGIGISRKPEGKILNAINWINSFNNKKVKVISIDIPSGLDANNGTFIGKAVKANTTVMCLTQKQGCYTGDGLNYSGKVVFDDLGIKNAEDFIQTKVSLINSNQYIPLLRNKNSYKGTYGNLLILGGFDGMQGAANLCGLASLRTGVGKVFLCNNKNTKKVDEIISIPNCIEGIKKYYLN
jgi:NAD(P)H-hydrate epimerase